MAFVGTSMRRHLQALTLGFILGFFTAGSVLLFLPSYSCQATTVISPTNNAQSAQDYSKGGSCFSIPKHENLTDPWTYVKLPLPPAQCLVRGMSVEELDPENNFRRGWALGYTNKLGDKSYLLPYLRAARDVTMHTSKRRILLDLGARYFSSSVEWFLRHYPLEFTEIHAFEALIGRFRHPQKLSRVEMQNILMPMNESSIRVRSGRYGLLPNAIVGKVQRHVGWVDVEDGETLNLKGKKVIKYNITKYIKATLKIKPEDAFIVKMDIGGVEWKVLPVWMEDPLISELVDELFVEVHYHDASMAAFNWSKERYPQTRGEATSLLQQLRSHGFYAHSWP